MTHNSFAPEMGERNDVDQPGSVAIVHDYLTQRGGAERVVLAMHRAFPAAPIYTSLYEPDLTYPEFREMDIRPSYLNHSRLLRQQHRLSFPLLAHAFSTMKVEEQVVLCSSSGWAHGVRANGAKLVYCHTPARWLYKTDEAFRRVRDSRSEPGRLSVEHVYVSRIARGSLRVVGPMLRRWDRKAAASASQYFTNGSLVSEEISAFYGIRPLVISPPPLCRDDGPWERPDILTCSGFFLTVARLMPHKNLNRIFEVFARRPDLDLVVVGSGPLAKELQDSAPENVALVGNMSDGELRWLYGHCQALIAGAFEDYGLTPLEVGSFGKPTIALKRGGYLETVVEGLSGYFFEDLEFESISGAIDELARHPLDSDEIREHAARFSEERFIDALRDHVSAYL
jgi:glycosyltransferase involved in cell wall biosynthesis